jgi:hypothetical protein
MQRDDARSVHTLPTHQRQAVPFGPSSLVLMSDYDGGVGRQRREIDGEVFVKQRTGSTVSIWGECFNGSW